MFLIDVHTDEDYFAAKFEFSQVLVDAIKTLPNRVFMKKEGLWAFPVVDLFILKKIAKAMGVEVKVTPEANKRYKKLSDSLAALKTLSDAKDSDHTVDGLRDEVKLYDFQKVGVHFLDTVQSGLMGYDMGLGKTPIGISVVSNAIQRFGAKKALIVVPASMKYQWGYQIAKFSGYSYTMVAGKDREELYKKNTNFIIVNYDLLWRDIDIIKDMEWDIVICDEIQRARNFRTDTFKALNKLKCKRRIGLTGTPIENDLMDLFTIMKFLNPKVFGTNPFPFINRYCTLDFFGRIDHSKYKNLDEINKKLSYSMIRRRKREVLDELPEKVVNHIYINLNPTERKKYKEIKNGILEDIKTGKIKNVAALAQTVYLRQICDALNLVVEKDKIVSSKLEEVKKIVAELPKDSKIIIFTQFERMAKIIEDNIGMKSVHLHGGIASDCRWEREIEKDTIKENKGMNQRDLDVLVYEEKLKSQCAACPYYNDDEKCNTRKKIQAKFQNEDDIRLFISTNAGASGLDLQVASVLINYDMSFNPAVNEQRIARIDRMGQKAEKILIINLVCLDTIEEKVLKITEKKQKLFDEVIDNKLDEDEYEKLVFNTNTIKDII